MNINFHYYAVMAIARYAGLAPAQAQLVAEFSQFVDDYTTSGTITIANPGGAGYDAAKALGLVKKKGDNHTIKSVQTGFAGLDYLWSLGDKFQNRTIVPFHFIPSFKLTSHIYHRTAVPAILGDGSVISNALAQMMQQYREHPEDNRCVIGLGVLLHVFADTYAHQRFNGHWDGMFQSSFNCYTVQQAWKNTAYGVRGADVTGEYDSSKFKGLPAVGHATAGHAPDDTDITVTLRFCNNINRDYTRSNTDEFAKAAREIYRCLYYCKQGAYPEETLWEKLKARLLPGFLVKNGTDPNDEMLHAWAKAFDEFGFAYTKEHVAGKLFRDITLVEWQDPGGKMPSSQGGGDIYSAVLSADNRVKSMRAAVSDEFYWFMIAAHNLRSEAVSSEYLL